MARRWVIAAILALAWAGPSSQAGSDAPASDDATLTFTSHKGSPPQPKVVPIPMDAEHVEPAVRYAGPAGWLRATISQTAAARSLVVQPKPVKLGPGVYHATIDLGDAARRTARVDVALAVLASSRASCPPRSTLRYEGGGDGAAEPADFGKTFFRNYCVSCHASTKAGDARSGAPRGLDWDSPSIIRAQLYAIDEVAARGPGESHDDMPPADAARRPTEAERAMLGRWISCGAP
jgi:hypothetical protein